MNVAVIGAGVSGLSVARLLSGTCGVTVFERESRPGGLIKCETRPEGLFHTCGGHVFNSKDRDVLKWFWGLFDRERDFVRADRNSAIFMDDGRYVGYPIENHVYQLPEDVQQAFYRDLEDIESKAAGEPPRNFEEFLKGRFGETLYRLYFGPYNAKVWRRSLADVPLSWLAGKLPAPTVAEMRRANAERIEEREFVHSSFWYARRGGSQFIADTMAKGLHVECGHDIRQVEYRDDGRWCVEGLMFDRVVFCGNIRDLPGLLRGISLDDMSDAISRLEFHGTTTAFCRIDGNPYSWIYQPSARHDSHRIICTGNLSPDNSRPGTLTATVEFTDRIGRDAVETQLAAMPLHPRLIDMAYNGCTYPIQHRDTRALVASVRERLSRHSFHLVGRFAEWEYHNMDAAIASAMRTCREMGNA